MITTPCLILRPLVWYQQVIQSLARLSNPKQSVSHDIPIRLIVFLPVLDDVDQRTIHFPYDP